jgi:hypothetical protein
VKAHKKTKAAFKKFYGILVPSRDKTDGGMSLLTPQGHLVRIAKNSKFRKMGGMLFEPVKVIGRVFHRGSGAVLDVLYVSSDNEIPPPLTADLWFHPTVRPHSLWSSADYEATVI